MSKDKTEPKKSAGFDFAEIVTDKTAKEEGKWLDFSGGLELFIAAFENEKMAKASHKLIRKKNKRGFRTDYIDWDEMGSEEEGATLISKYILLDWRGMKYEGKPIEYSQAKAKEFLMLSDEFARAVIAASRDESNYRKKEAEEAKGN